MQEIMSNTTHNVRIDVEELTTAQTKELFELIKPWAEENNLTMSDITTMGGLTKWVLHITMRRSNAVNYT